MCNVSIEVSRYKYQSVIWLEGMCEMLLQLKTIIMITVSVLSVNCMIIACGIKDTSNSVCKLCTVVIEFAHC